MSKAKDVTMWSNKLCLSNGGKVYEITGYKMSCWKGEFLFVSSFPTQSTCHYIGVDCFDTREEALQSAEHKKQARLVSLKKQLDKVSAVEFSCEGEAL